MKPGFNIVIPARLASQRLPEKPLARVAGRTLIEHVHRCALQTAARCVVIATDSEEIRAEAEGFGAQVVMTGSDHSSGSDRIRECIDRLGWDDDTVIVNLQGDEPLMPAACLEQAAALIADTPGAVVASLYLPVTSQTEATDPNVVKVVVDRDGAALYFSRALIPFPRGGQPQEWRRHVGLYAYRASALRAFATLTPGPLERAEKLEQLRFLENGYRIVMERACEHIPPGVDTPEDLQRLRAHFSGDERETGA